MCSILYFCIATQIFHVCRILPIKSFFAAILIRGCDFLHIHTKQQPFHHYYDYYSFVIESHYEFIALPNIPILCPGFMYLHCPAVANSLISTSYFFLPLLPQLLHHYYYCYHQLFLVYAIYFVWHSCTLSNSGNCFNAQR